MKIERFSSAQELQERAAGTIVQLLNNGIREAGRATFVLSGGSTPEAIYTKLGAEPLRSQLDWSKIHIFWGDERCVAPTHPESNFRLARKALLEEIDIPDENIHRIEAERSPDEASRLYEQHLRSFFGVNDIQFPQFDVMLLGMGNEGHTASLFPGTTILRETDRMVADVFVPKLQAQRISFTLPVINNSRSVLIIVSGEEKAVMLAEVLEGAPDRYPVQLVRPVHGTLRWLVDDKAASLLQNAQPAHNSSLNFQ